MSDFKFWTILAAVIAAPHLSPLFAAVAAIGSLLLAVRR